MYFVLAKKLRKSGPFPSEKKKVTGGGGRLKSGPFPAEKKGHEGGGGRLDFFEIRKKMYFGLAALKIS